MESIGIRSTRIRGIDRTLTTVPNGVLSKMPVVNLTQRDRMLLKAVIIGLRTRRGLTSFVMCWPNCGNCSWPTPE